MVLLRAKLAGTAVRVEARGYKLDDAAIEVPGIDRKRLVAEPQDLQVFRGVRSKTIGQAKARSGKASRAKLPALSSTDIGETRMAIEWYFDFISPFAWLQWPKVARLASERDVALLPVLFAGLLKHHGQKGPAEIPGKREFTYRHVLWRALQEGRHPRFPPAHPFKSLAALRLCVAAGSSVAATSAIFRWIWDDGHAGDSADALRPVAEELGIRDVVAATSATVVKARLRATTDQAIARGVFGVPTLALDGRLFWGDDAHGFALACLRDPALWDGPEMHRVANLPVAAHRGA